MPKSKQNTENRTVPIRKTNAELRTREYLTPAEVAKLVAHVRKNRQGVRDAAMVTLAFRHGLRATEVCRLRWEQFDLKQGTVHINRLKNGIASVHPLGGEELRLLRKLQREQPQSRHLFVSERGAPMTSEGFRKLIVRAGERASFPFPLHPHMLRHACGYKLANDGQDTRSIQVYMGHQNIKNTVVYTELSAERFKNFWDD